MSDDTTTKQDHPYVAHYDWPNAGKWRVVLVLATVVALIFTTSLAVRTEDVTQGVIIVVAVVWYCVLIAVWQWRRSVRLASAVERLETYSP
jgi:hypothetical protein